MTARWLSPTSNGTGTVPYLPVKCFAGVEVVDEVLGPEFIRLPGDGREAISILRRNKVGIGFQGPAFPNFHFNAFPCIHLVFKGIQDFEGSTVYVIINPARTDCSLGEAVMPG